MWYMVGVRRRLTAKLRAELKKPYGELIRGEEGHVEKVLREKLAVWKPRRVIAVGDKVSETLAAINPRSGIYIYDGVTKRVKIPFPKIPAVRCMDVENPAGTLTDEAMRVVREALRSEGTVYISVRGEEDLLTLAAVAYAPLKALVIYGQPDEGVVVVKVNRRVKSQVKKLIDEMEMES